MKKYIAFALVLAVVVGLSACATAPQQNATAETTATTEATAAPTEATSVPTQIPSAQTDATATAAPTDETAETMVTTEATTAPTTAPSEAPTEASTEAPTEEPHSEFYVADVTEDEIVAYFNEMVLDMKDAAGNSEAYLVRKWDHPIIYRIEGAPALRDGQSINRLVKELNQIEGFPGIQASTGLEHNVTISFLREEEYKAQFSYLFDGEMEDGVMQFWNYSESNSVFYGRIGYCKDAEQEVRDVVIPRELIELLGINNTARQEIVVDGEVENDQKDSDKKYDEASVLNDLDLAMVKLLYNPRIHCGMNAGECEMIIRELYY